MKIVLSKHARDRLRERGMTVKDIVWVLANPDQNALSDGIAFKAVRESSPHMDYVVIYEPINNGVKIVTIYKRSK